ncbi:MAG: hypothetical protein JST59_01300 [Actinobacteria bacterium]|nr:hypothetical protein [Actinomycetota bacterium]
MGKQLVEQPVVKPPRTKKLVKRPLQVETVSGERPYEVQPLKDYEQYLEIKSKRYNRYRK